MVSLLSTTSEKALHAVVSLALPSVHPSPAFFPFPRLVPFSRASSPSLMLLSLSLSFRTFSLWSLFFIIWPSVPSPVGAPFFRDTVIRAVGGSLCTSHTLIAPPLFLSPPVPDVGVGHFFQSWFHVLYSGTNMCQILDLLPFAERGVAAPAFRSFGVRASWLLVDLPSSFALPRFSVSCAVPCRPSPDSLSLSLSLSFSLSLSLCLSPLLLLQVPFPFPLSSRARGETCAQQPWYVSWYGTVRNRNGENLLTGPHRGSGTMMT